MRMIRQDVFGGPEVLGVVDSDPPEPEGTEVQVRVHAAGVNPVDWKTREGNGVLDSPPFTVGWDVSGVVSALGLGVTRFAVGDEVFGMPRFPREAAAYAEYVTAPSRQLARKPAGLDHVHAAALPLAGLTAWQTLVDTAAVTAGQRVLVAGAAGGVGHLAVQIAKARGAYVIGTAREARHAFVRDLGADEVVDHTRADPALAVRDLDVVLDPVGSTRSAYSWLDALRPGGVLLPFGADLDEALLAAAAERSVRVALVLVEPDGHGLEALGRLVDEGRLRVEVQAVLPLERAGEAHANGARGGARGKTVLTV